MPRFTKKIATFVGLVERKFLLPMPPSVTPNEQFLHYVWFRKLFAPEQTTTDGRRVEIIDTGQRNTDAIVLTEASCLVLRYPKAHMRIVMS